jgi:signal peptidase
MPSHNQPWRPPAWRAAALYSALGLATLITLAATLGPRILPYHTYVVMSGSMTPAIPVGALVIDQPVQGAQLRVGDVISFTPPDHLHDTITHRIYAIKASSRGMNLITKGDANNTADGWALPAAGTIWRVSFAIPWLGYIFGSTTMLSGHTLFVLLPAGALAGLLLYELWRPQAGRSLKDEGGRGSI